LEVLDKRERKAVIKDTEDKLYRINMDDIVLYKGKYMIPSRLIFSIVYGYHIEMGHLKQTVVMDKVQQWFYYKNLKDYVSEVMRACQECQRAKGARENQGRYNMVLQTPVGINQVWQLDFMGPLPEDDGYKYILTGMDYFDNRIVIEPLKSIKGYEVIAALIKRIILPYAPQIFKTDLGQPFMGHIYKDICLIFQIQVKYTTGYRPQSQGKIERSHRTINGMIMVNNRLIDMQKKTEFGI